MNLLELNVGDLAPVPPEPRAEEEIVAEWDEDQERPLVSVLCDTYQHVNFIRDALNGFLMQRTTFPFEVIVHDDASTDGTRQIVQEYAERYPRIVRTILQSENQFRRGNRPWRLTFPAARGRYIALCEGDDYWLDPLKLSAQVLFLQRSPWAVLCGHRTVVVEDGVIMSPPAPVGGMKYTRDQLKKAQGPRTMTLCFRNRVSEYVDEQSEVLNGDLFLRSRLGVFGGGATLSDVLPSVYRHHEGGVWSKQARVKQEANFALTFFWLSQYHARVGDFRLARYFQARAVRSVVGRAHFFQGDRLLLVDAAGAKRALGRVVRRVLSGYRKPTSS